jgi:hypothetical protein
MIALLLPCDGMDSSRRWFESHQSFWAFFCFQYIKNKQSVYRLKNNGVFGDRTSVPLKLICHIKDVCLVMEWIVLEGGSNPISPFVCLSTLLSLASERHFWL